MLSTYATYQGGKDAFTPLGFGSDGTLYAIAHGDNDTTRLFTIDLATGKPKPDPLVVTPGYDFTGSLVRSGEKVLGVQIRTDADRIVWFDPAMEAVQKKLDATLPGTINLMSFPSGNHVGMGAGQVVLRRAAARLLRLSTSRPARSTRWATAYPGIDPARMGRRIRCATRRATAWRSRRC